MKKRIFALLLSLCLILSTSQISFATTNTPQANETVSALLNIVETSQVNLYNSEDEYCATYFKLEDGGYIIVDSSMNSIIEYSIDSDPTNYSNNGNKQVYLGPTNYYEKLNSGNTYFDKNKRRNQNLSESAAKEIDTSKNSCSGTFVDGSTYSEVIGQVSLSAQDTLPYTTVLVDNNVNGTCGSTAATILFLYYEDHIDTKYITSAERSNYNGLTETLISFIEPNYGGTTYSELKGGINDFLEARNLDKSCAYVTLANVITSPLYKVKSYIDSDRPCIIGLKSSTPTYGAHWVVATGYTTYTWTQPQTTTPYAQFIQINDGWGSRGIWINYDYVDGAIYLK